MWIDQTIMETAKTDDLHYMGPHWQTEYCQPPDVVWPSLALVPLVRNGFLPLSQKTNTSLPKVLGY